MTRGFWAVVTLVYAVGVIVGVGVWGWRQGRGNQTVSEVDDGWTL